MAKHKLTKQVLERAVQLKRDGLNDKDICAAIGVSPSTFYRWINTPQTNLQRSLSEELKKAESDYKSVLLNTIRSAALEKSGNWTAAAWLLERKYPEEFSQNRIQQNQQQEMPTVVLGVAVGVAQGDLPGAPTAAQVALGAATPSPTLPVGTIGTLPAGGMGTQQNLPQAEPIEVDGFGGVR